MNLPFLFAISVAQMQSNQELQEFRDKWLSEVASNKVLSKTTSTTSPKDKGKSKPTIPASILDDIKSDLIKPKLAVEPIDVCETPLQIYIQATKFERTGNLSKALEYYRKAIKLDPEVEYVYRDEIKLNKTTVSEEDQQFYTYYNFGDDRKPTQDLDSSLILRFSLLNTSFIPKDEEQMKSFNKLPQEIIINIIKWSVIEDISHILNLCLVSKKMFLLTREHGIYKFLCERMMIVQYPFHSLEAELREVYRSNWFSMFLEKPRIRFNGVYISRVNYMRSGEAETYYQPIHMITYFRYLRFYTDGTALMLTSTIEPQRIVRQLNPTLKGTLKGLCFGYFEFDGTTVKLSLKDDDRKGYSFTFELKIVCVKGKWQTKMEWVEYNVEKIGSHSSVIPLNSLKPFHFSKVKSYK